MTRARRLALVLPLVLAGFAAPAAAKTRGLVFGVSAYPNFSADRQLRAPKNDVARILRAFSARGLAEADFVVLAEGAPQSKADPTRAAILGALERLVEEAERGDLVIVYGSGHGSRQAAHAARKSDGLDQLFLPRDAAPAPSGAKEPFANAIVSTEFGARLDAIRRKGADVWFILDSCFSGAASRDVGESVRDKQIDPGEIGVGFAAAMTPDQTLPLADQPQLPEGSGKLVAFYASQPNETAREAALPPNLPLEKRAWGSIFTLALSQALERGRALTYRQTLVEAARLLRADPAFQSRQTPSFEGDALDLKPPGAAPAHVGAAWRVEEGVVLAGKLEGLDDGALVALYATAEAAADKPLARAVVVEAQPLQARLAALKAGCDALAAPCPRDDKSAAPKQAAYARLLRPAPGAALRVGALRALPGAREPAYAEAARAALSAALDGPLQARVARDEASPDLIGWMGPQGLRLTPNGVDPASVENGPMIEAALFADKETGAQALARALLRARQTLGLQKLTRASGGGGLVVSSQARRFGAPDGGKCAFGNDGAPVAEGASLELCDKMIVTIENQGGEAVLPAIFFLDDGWNLIARRPACPVGLSVADRLEPGRRMTLEIPYHARAIKPGLAPSTVNGLFVIGAPFRPGEADLPNLCGLTMFNDGAGAATRSADDDLDALISGATRGGPRLALEAADLSLSFWPVKQPVRP
jgi:hypothetical protein